MILLILEQILKILDHLQLLKILKSIFYMLLLIIKEQLIKVIIQFLLGIL